MFLYVGSYLLIYGFESWITNVCNCDMFIVVNVYLDHLKVCLLS